MITVAYESADMINSPEGWMFNYCWRNAGTIKVPANLSESQITRRVKKELGISGIRHAALWRSGSEVAARLYKTTVGFNWRVEV